MKIGLVIPPLLKTPPTGYGGLEEVAYDLCCALAEKGEDVTLIAPAGSHAEGCKVFETITAPERTDVNWIQLEYDAFMKYQQVLPEFDIIHDHSWFGFPYLTRFEEKHRGIKICHTHHGHLDWNVKATRPEILPVNLIGISSYMASEYKAQGWESKYVYNGIDLSKYAFSDKKENRAVFVGRISPLKKPDIAIRAAVESGIPIDVIGGSFVAPTEKPYIEAVRKQCDESGGLATLYLDCPQDKKIEICQGAMVTLVPSSFKEPFGLVAIESLAMGTPVLAYDDGALKEIINSDKIGAICTGYDDMASRIKKMNIPSPFEQKACRTRAEYFSREKMADRYMKVYKEVIDGKGW